MTARPKIILPMIHATHQGRALILGYLAFSAIYLGSASLNLSAPHLLQPGAVDLAIPLIESSIWIYLSQFLLTPSAIFYARNDQERSHAFYAMLMATALAAICFIGWPTEIARQAPQQTGLTAYAWTLLYLSDTPRNCFPSLHVALAVIAGTALWRAGYRTTGLIWPTLIIASTLTTKQHVVLDVAGGLMLAPLAWNLTGNFIRYERTQPADCTAN